MSYEIDEESALRALHPLYNDAMRENEDYTIDGPDPDDAYEEIHQDDNFEQIRDTLIYGE